MSKRKLCRNLWVHLCMLSGVPQYLYGETSICNQRSRSRESRNQSSNKKCFNGLPSFVLLCNHFLSVCTVKGESIWYQDVNLWRSEMWRSTIQPPPPPPSISTIRPIPQIITCLVCCTFFYMMCRPSEFAFKIVMKLIIISDEICSKMSQELYYEWKKFLEL